MIILINVWSCVWVRLVARKRPLFVHDLGVREQVNETNKHTNKTQYFTSYISNIYMMKRASAAVFLFLEYLDELEEKYKMLTNGIAINLILNRET